MFRSSAWLFALVYVALIVYASLFPFSGWRDQGVPMGAFLWAAYPVYWTGFDVVINLLGYAPLGGLLALGLLRGGWAPWAAAMAATVTGLLLSVTMEGTQTFLPTRIPSNVDALLNTLGAAGGAVAAVLAHRWGGVDRWLMFRNRWFVADSGVALLLLIMWPVALWFPTAVPLGLGQVMDRLEPWLADVLAGGPFLEWLPVRDIELQPMTPLGQLLVVACGLLAPLLLAHSVVQRPWRRLMMVLGLAGGAVMVLSLSSALSFGPAQALVWVRPPVIWGGVAGLLGGLLLLPLPRRACAAAALVALVLMLSMLNQSSSDAYLAVALQTWEQGRFMRFHGLAQWAGWLWPYVALTYTFFRISRPWGRNGPEGFGSFTSS